MVWSSFRNSSIFYNKRAGFIVTAWLLWLGFVSIVFLLPAPENSESITLGMMSLAAFVTALLMGARSRKTKGKEKKAWRLLCVFFAGMSLDSFSNVINGGASTPPEIVLPLACILLTALLLLSWDLLSEISRARIILDSFWISTMILGAGWFLFVSPFLEIESTDLWDHLSFASTPTIGLVGFGIITSIVYQTKGQGAWGFGFIGYSLFSLCIVTVYEILAEAKGEIAFLEGYDYFWHLSLTLTGIGSQISIDNKPVNILPENPERRHLVWLTLAPLVIGFPILFLSSPSQFRGIIIFAAVTLTLLALRIMAIDKENNALNKRLRTMALSDQLTNIPNRRGLIDYIEKKLGRQEALGVVFIDLDNFKHINDTYGHESGDFVLIEVAERLQKTIRSEDFLARLGGDEFIVCTNKTSTAHLKTLADRLLGITEEPCTFPAGSAKIGLTTGIATAEPGMNAATLLDKADKKMLERKPSLRV